MTPVPDETFSLLTRAHSEVGLVRKTNQDSAYCSGNMLLVADGMGGAAAGDLASAVAVKEIATADRRLHGDDMISALSAAMSRANDTIADLIEIEPGLDGMGTTVCGALFSGTQLGMVHLGDSRGYLLRGGKLTQVTHDHSWVQSLVDEGKLHEDEMATHPHRSLLLRVLNGQPVNDPDTGVVDVELGDRVLFCSDGLSGFTTASELERIVKLPDLDAVVAQLAEAAREGGGADNITFVVADVVPQSDDLDQAAGEAFGAAANADLREIVDNLTQAAREKTASPLAQGVATKTTVGSISPSHHDDVDADTDTLPGTIPAVGGTAVTTGTAGSATLDPETLRYQPRKRRRRWVPTVSLLAAVLLLVAGAGVGGYYYLGTQYFVGSQTTAAGAKVAIYQGTPDTLLGRPLNRVVQSETTFVNDLPKYYRQQVNATITTNGLDDAQQTVLQLQQMALVCIAQRGSVGAQSPTDPSTTPGTSTSPTSTGASSSTPAHPASGMSTTAAKSPASSANTSDKTQSDKPNTSASPHSTTLTTTPHAPSSTSSPGTANAEQDCS